MLRSRRLWAAGREPNLRLVTQECSWADRAVVQALRRLLALSAPGLVASVVGRSRAADPGDGRPVAESAAEQVPRTADETNSAGGEFRAARGEHPRLDNQFLEPHRPNSPVYERRADVRGSVVRAALGCSGEHSRHQADCPPGQGDGRPADGRQQRSGTRTQLHQSGAARLSAIAPMSSSVSARALSLRACHGITSTTFIAAGRRTLLPASMTDRTGPFSVAVATRRSDPSTNHGEVPDA